MCSGRWKADRKRRFSAALGRYLTALGKRRPQRYLEQGMAGIIKALGEHSGTPTPPGLRDEVYRLVERKPKCRRVLHCFTKKLEMLFADSFPILRRARSSPAQPKNIWKKTIEYHHFGI